MVSPKAVIGICAGVSATIFLGYCIYFDKQRHNDPNFKKKLRESMWYFKGYVNILILLFCRETRQKGGI